MKNVNGRIFEEIKFSNGIIDYFYSDYLHKINAICNLYGYDINNFNQFRIAQSKYKSETYFQPV